MKVFAHAGVFINSELILTIIAQPSDNDGIMKSRINFKTNKKYVEHSAGLQPILYMYVHKTRGENKQYPGERGGGI
jgi:hypothetical protein